MTKARYVAILVMPRNRLAHERNRLQIGGGFCQGSEDDTEQLLRRLTERTTCDWCKHPVKLIHRKGLCRHCYSIRANTIRLGKKIEEYKKKAEVVPSELDFRYRLTQAMETDAKTEGEYGPVDAHNITGPMETDAKTEGEYGPVDAHNINGLNLEHRFSYVSRMFVHQDLYHGYASIFDDFTPRQKRLLAFLLSLMTRAYLRRTRRHRALVSISMPTTD